MNLSNIIVFSSFEQENLLLIAQCTMKRAVLCALCGKILPRATIRRVNATMYIENEHERTELYKTR